MHGGDAVQCRSDVHAAMRGAKLGAVLPGVKGVSKTIAANLAGVHPLESEVWSDTKRLQDTKLGGRRLGSAVAARIVETLHARPPEPARSGDGSDPRLVSQTRPADSPSGAARGSPLPSRACAAC